MSDELLGLKPTNVDANGSPLEPEECPEMPNGEPELSVAVSDPVSPTGTPLLPTSAVPFLVGLVALATGLTSVLPPHTIGFKVATFVVGLGSLFGLASPGWRRK